MTVGSAWEVLTVFLRLGLTSFGGPIAHLGYFRAEFVERRRWLDDASFTDLVALCQFLPGPSSSQVGLAIGLGRAGWRGALAAWAGFTAPSAVALVLFAMGVHRWSAWALSPVVHGLKVVAVAVVAQAVWGMARTLCPDRLRAGLAIAAALIAWRVPGSFGQFGALALGALAGRWAIAGLPASAAAYRTQRVSRTVGATLLLAVALGLVALPWWAAVSGAPAIAALAVTFRAGALTFGGGHVVLPWLQAGVVPPGWISNDLFMAGYGAAQAVPGPLFTFAAYLGALMPAPLGGAWGAFVLLIAIFVPGALLVVGALPYWDAMRRRQGVRRALAGGNAAVVGILLAALYDPVWTTSIRGLTDAAWALAAFGLLVRARWSPVWVVLVTAMGSALLTR